MFERLGEELRSPIIFASDGTISYKWKKQEGEEDQGGPYMPLEEVVTTQRDASHKRRMHAQELVKHIFIFCGARMKHGENDTRCASEGRERERTWNDADDASKLSALSQRLLERWRTGASASRSLQ